MCRPLRRPSAPTTDVTFGCNSRIERVGLSSRVVVVVVVLVVDVVVSELGQTVELIQQQQWPFLFLVLFRLSPLNGANNLRLAELDDDDDDAEVYGQDEKHDKRKCCVETAT